jgi:signal transduction histidine kinase
VKGKGLGLYLCKLLVERYGGTIWIEDRVPGHHEMGTIVKFRLKKPPMIIKG